jgi:hypothetical protein
MKFTKKSTFQFQESNILDDNILIEKKSIEGKDESYLSLTGFKDETEIKNYSSYLKFDLSSLIPDEYENMISRIIELDTVNKQITLFNFSFTDDNDMSEYKINFENTIKSELIINILIKLHKVILEQD